MTTGKEDLVRLKMTELLFDSLRVGDARHNARAIELFTLVGTGLVHSLVMIAIDKEKPPGYRLRAMEAIGRIGGELPTGDFMDLESSPAATGTRRSARRRPG